MAIGPDGRTTRRQMVQPRFSELSEKKKSSYKPFTGNVDSVLYARPTSDGCHSSQPGQYWSHIKHKNILYAPEQINTHPHMRINTYTLYEYIPVCLSVCTTHKVNLLSCRMDL